MEIKEKMMREVERTVAIECDKCKKKIEHENAFDVTSCRIQRREGSNYPGCSTGTLENVDLCEECAEGLFKWFRFNGYRINEIEV